MDKFLSKSETTKLAKDYTMFCWNWRVAQNF